MTESKKYGGKLENWFLIDIGYSCWGNLYNDPSKRWEDGTEVRTSSVVKIDRDKMQIETRNSVYDLGKPKEKEF